MILELERHRQQPARGPLRAQIRARRPLPGELVQVRFRIKKVRSERPTVHEQMNDPLGARLKMRQQPRRRRDIRQRRRRARQRREQAERAKAAPEAGDGGAAGNGEVHELHSTIRDLIKCPVVIWWLATGSKQNRTLSARAATPRCIRPGAVPRRTWRWDSGSGWRRGSAHQRPHSVR